MDRTIRLGNKKEIGIAAEKKIMKLKGLLIAEGYTDIIHFDDQDELHYVNHFVVDPGVYENVLSFIKKYAADNGLDEVIYII